MPEAPIYRYEVTFEATEIDQGRSIVGLALSREGTAAAPSSTFFFEPKEEMTPEATRLLAQFLSEYTEARLKARAERRIARVGGDPPTF